MARSVVHWNACTGTHTHVFCWRDLCQGRTSLLRNCWFKLPLNLFKLAFVYTHGTRTSAVW
ncbi:hypothetical protein CIB84_005388 [Bambusicola thoracicus]|uniref:Uncharacterized protein n=1 Tax=Bambusicola thoracicus TaxID=9083 RepID=A0A2P4T3E2_BAMTH|nr:hypothetical protein CIB84_005388 [Bambusicola thoracicus]